MALALELIPGVHDRPVTRPFISKMYGGSSQATFSTISDDKRKERGHDYHGFLCPMASWNPYQPQIPGQPGLFFYLGEDKWDVQWPVFVSAQPNEWLYVGDYEGHHVEPLTAAEWHTQSAEVRFRISVSMTSNMTR